MPVPIPPDYRLAQLELHRLRTDGGTQSRAEVSPQVAQDYADDLLAGHDLPAVVCFHDGTDYWLSSGFHRLRAHELARRRYINVKVCKGTVEDARLYAAAQNTQHGTRRSDADKRRAVVLVLQHPLGSTWTVKQVALHCAVSEGLVRALRDALEEAGPWEPEVGLFGPLEDSSPSSPEEMLRRAEAQGEREMAQVAIGCLAAGAGVALSPALPEEDRDPEEDARTWVRSQRAYRKLLRFFRRLSIDPREGLTRLEREEADREERLKRHTRRKAVVEAEAEPVGA